MPIFDLIKNYSKGNGSDLSSILYLCNNQQSVARVEANMTEWMNSNNIGAILPPQLVSIFVLEIEAAYE
ncbi:MAG TPA: hypothetical protein P5511_00955 [Candidatus Goldiibacteriota bacterium]|nr:hypothetical protein [Candidatus Goldiibacteriota bacterium]